MGLEKYIAERIIQAFFVIIAVIIINFIIVSAAPGDPIQFIAGDIAINSPEFATYLRHKWGLDRPLYERIFTYIFNIFQGDLGYSYRYLQPVSQLILERLPVTLLLMITSNVLAFIIGILLGLYSARKNGSFVDTSITSLNFLFWSTPSFLLGIILMMIFGVNLKIFPVAGLIDVRNPKEGFWLYLDIVYHSVLPIITLTLITMPLYFKVVRDTVIQQSVEEYAYMYRAIGLNESKIYKKVFRNAILPPVTLFAIHIGFAVAGAALIENVFGWPGVGRLLLDAISARDYPIIMGIYLFISITVVLANLIVDILYAYLDPRIRLQKIS